MSSKLTDNEKQQIVTAFRAAMNEETRDTLTQGLWERYKDTSKEFDAHSYVNSVAQLFRLVPRGTEIACVYLRSAETYSGNANRHWKVFVAHTFDGRQEVCLLTGYLLNVGIGRKSRSEHETELVTNGYGSDIASWLSQFLYGTTDDVRYRTF